MLRSIFAKQNQPFLKSWIKYNPTKEIEKLTIPTLIIHGTKDTQVPVKETKLLHRAKTDSKLVIIKNMNHVLKNIEKDEDNMKSYFSPNYSVSKELINSIVTFIDQ